MPGVANRQFFNPGQRAGGGLEVNHHLPNGVVEAPMQANPVLEHPLCDGGIGPGLEFDVEDRHRILGSVFWQQDHRVGMEWIAAQLPVEQLPRPFRGFLLTGEREHPAPHAGGMAGHQAFAEVIDHR